MPYIGNTIRAADDYRLIDDISSGFNGSETSFALQVAGSAPVPFPKSPQQVLISVNGVIQEPDPTGSSGFNLVGTNIVFSSAPTNGHAFFGIIYATADYLNAGGNFPAGSLGAPSITFIGDENTGLFRKSGGSVGFVSDATEIANFDSNGITISSGNLIIPDSIIHNGDTNTKIRFPAADTVSVETSGSERLRVNTSGKVGINETNPTEMLHIKAEDNTDSFGGLIIKANNNSVHMKYGWRGLDANGGGDIRFAVGGTEMMRVLSSGKVGLGRTSADEMLHIVHDDNTDGFGGIKIDANNGSINCKYGWLGADGSNSFRIGVAGTERMRVANDGNVGIGTTSPTANLHLKDGSGNTEIKLQGGASTANDVIAFLNSAGSTRGNITYDTDNNFLLFNVNTSEKMRIKSDGDIQLTRQTGGGGANETLLISANYGSGSDQALQASNSLRFYSNGANERMRIASDGKIGIGTTSPAETLHVNGGDIIISTATAPNLRIVKADNSSGGSTNRVFLGIASGNNNFLNGSVDNDTCLVYSQGGKLLIGTGTSVEAGFDSSGNLGVGTASPDSRISIIGTGSDAVTRLSVTDGAGVADFLGRYGNIILNADRNAAVSGSLMAFKVDNNEHMRITDSGAVGIGISSPNYKLHVKGGVVDQTARFDNSKTGNNDINYIGVGLNTATTGSALFGHTGNTTAGSQAAWMGCGGDDVAGGFGVKAFRGGNVEMKGTLRVNTGTQYGKLHVVEGSFNPGASTWLSEVSYVASGSFGGGYSLLDGSKGYSMYCSGSGNHFSIQHHSSTTAGASGGVSLINAATSWTSASDERDKENLVTISDAITKIKTLRTVIGNYTWQPDEKHAFLIAQDVQAVLPEAVDITNTYKETGDQRLGLRYTEVIPLLTAALKEAVAEIDTLKTKVAALEAA